ncbi:hypothetical protein H6A16_04460 [Collinsella tanakaei]|uniref:VapE domain-containing protein n=1 Tax=Collinsella tanakaei TaxID=626935 RepID=UPI00195895E1|nr:VapE domain-containing protein [Collinsella tanakaei]MBM6778748.1 hypothetical protein [Collinsella tanakaei]
MKRQDDEMGPSRNPSIIDIVGHLEDMGIELGFNMLVREPFKTGPLPWAPSNLQRPWTDTDDSRLYAALQSDIGLRSDRNYEHAVRIYADNRSYDPLVNLLDSLHWDGAERAGSLFSMYLGAHESEYNVEVERLWLCEAVARAYHPGAKCDYTPVLAGPGGIGKSTFARLMALEDQLYCDSVNDLSDVKRCGELIRSKWIVELAELSGISGRALEGVKAGLTRQADEYRGAYCRRTNIFPRRAVFLATTNDIDFISDKTSGARRFLPVACGINRPTSSLFAPNSHHVAEQVWAEVVYWMKSGDERFRLTLSPKMEMEAARQRDNFREEDPLVHPVLGYLARNTDHPICTREVIERGLKTTPTLALCKHVARILTNDAPGWVASGKRLCLGYGKQRCWSHQHQDRD